MGAWLVLTNRAESSARGKSHGIGQSIGVVARDVNPACRSLSPLWLHCATSTQKRQLFAGNNDGCAPGRTAGTFVSEVYTISV